MEIKEIGCTVIDWIYLAQDRNKGRAFVNKVMNALILYAVSSGKGACVYVCGADGRL
jgi:amino acid permease